MNKKVRFYLKTVFHVVWILSAILIWSLSFSSFLNDKTFGIWMIWGFLCTLVIIPTAANFLWEGIKKGYNDGKQSYAGKAFDRGIYGGIVISIHNRRYSQAIISLVVGIIMLLLVGPILLPIKIVFSLVELVSFLRILWTDKAFTIKALRITGIVALGLLAILIVSLTIKWVLS